MEMCVSISLNMYVRGYLLTLLYNYGKATNDRPPARHPSIRPPPPTRVIRRKCGQILAIQLNICGRESINRMDERGRSTKLVSFASSSFARCPHWSIISLGDRRTVRTRTQRTKSSSLNAKSFNIHTVMAWTKSKCVQDGRGLSTIIIAQSCPVQSNPGQSSFKGISNDWKFGRSKIIGPLGGWW